MTASTAPHTLFVQPHCRYCELIVREIEQAELTNEFNTVDITTTQVDTTRISSTPAIIADHQHLMLGRDAFAWINNRKENAVHCIPYSASKSCTRWDAMSASFSFIEGGGDALTNTGMSNVYTGIDAVGATTPPADSRAANDAADPLTDALSRLQQERNAV